MNIELVKSLLKTEEFTQKLKKLYVDENRIEYNRDRFAKAIEKFESLYASNDIEIYSAPGRSEVCGNHTDHQNGKVLATSINLDAIAIVAKTDSDFVRIVSDEYPMEEIFLENLELVEKEMSTTKALIKGVLAGLKNAGYKLGGFDAYITSDVLIGAGMSSSAAFESLIGTIISGSYNEMKIDSIEIAKIGQYAENVYFGKPCGLMDQMACSVGGMVYIDFEDKDKPVVKSIDSDFESANLSLCIVDTKGSHEDLTPDYAAVPSEMKMIAVAMGKETLREVDEVEFIKNIHELREQFSDRAVLRAIHFYEEEKRVEKAVESLNEHNYEMFKQTIKASGDSSAKFLQNIYSPKDVCTQNVTVALAMTEAFLKDKGVCRVHGGGFAGTIQAFVDNGVVDEYKENIEKIFGEGSCHILKVRNCGGIKVL